MIKAILFKYIRRLFKAEIDDIQRKAYEESHDVINYERQSLAKVNLEHYIDKPVICISNEITDPVIGIGMSVIELGASKEPFLLVHDYVSNQQLMVLGKVFVYSRQKLEIVLDTNKIDLIVLLYHSHSPDLVTKQPIKELLSKEEILERLNRNGFFIKL